MEEHLRNVNIATTFPAFRIKNSWWSKSGLACFFKGHVECEYWHYYQVANPGPCDFVLCNRCDLVLRRGDESK